MEDNASQNLAPPDFTLTRRQMDCMKLVRNGLTSKQIARELGISPRTVDQHIAAVIDILQVNNRMAAVTRLQELGLDHRGEKQGGGLARPSAEADKKHGNLANAIGVGIVSQSVIPISAAIFPVLGGRANSASARQRLRWMIRIAIISIMASCMVVLTILGVSELASGGVP
ncbi:helix-turn-helix transcriptional regulator [Qipengyuania sp. GH1]|uniref:helix-turn-helix domain-containing protein n=1 Tax=Qipengyuania aestuarii TaxID=2867241 RepID=UPI001C88C426|nr:helix-turn-helix transcriptional regulator [Qipengyuania aestuarii]MBX7536025.1 helix-turn-helix transcriptional regulator [Qipengyuania aestuarii]